MNYRYYFALEKEIESYGYQVDRQEMVQRVAEKKTSLKQLKLTEYDKLIAHMNNFINDHKKAKKDASNDMRRKIIALFAKMGYLNDDGRVDMGRVYWWVKKHGYLKKNLNEYTQKELPVLVTQAEKVYISYIESTSK